MRYLGIDLGDKRTGLALGDDQTRLATPADVIDIPMGLAGGGPLIEAIVRAYDRLIGTATPGELVVGLPLNMDGTESRRSKVVRSFAARVQARIDREVRFQDERLTTAEADWAMAGADLTHRQKKDRRDALAAAAILRDFLSAAPGGSSKQDPLE
ncbi:MAG: Holliday junction resolvase RuvX [Phycisphaeraceae bacterium]|nr:Holliday junction resolvase RuvX [Phycisphaerae bacterium]MBX3392140.1 Holliday junction resolvase RuvX [Phycisphaeraceae bacterium]HRJ49900.1 Holliday junction resolvase RuvX [Phycisphaerales bacterium]